MTTLAPQAQVNCTANYTLTQADIDLGSITNTADATGTAPNSATVTSNSSTATVTATPSPRLTITKSANPTTIDTVGEQVTYTFAVQNTGNVRLTQVAVTETGFSGSGTLSAITCPTTTLAPAESLDCTARYTITQQDMDTGTVSNTASASALDPAGTTITSDPSTAAVAINAKPALTLVKTADTATITEAGQKIGYHFLITNTGTVTITHVTVDDNHFSGTGSLSTINCPTATLAPQATETCSASYTVTSEDLTATTLTNTATVTGSRGVSAASASVTSDPSTALVAITARSTHQLPQSSSGSGTSLPDTGTDVLGLGGIAAALLLAGVLVLVAARRRHLP
jgi:uncharacterized repeat protein (TIGR01451 family)/LPXTG-motif cell wall-anchored protein